MKKILIIEDNDDIRENIAEILDLAGYETVTAANGKEGVLLAESSLPDLILCDVMMPVLDGYGTLSILRKKPTFEQIPFIFLTAKSEKGDFRYGMNLGADDYITKPFESNELLQIIELRLKKVVKSMDLNSITSPNLFNEQKGTHLLAALKDQGENRHFLKKTPIYQEQTQARFLYFIQSGKVKISKTNSDGKELITHILRENDIFGLTAILQEKSYTDNATALEDVELILVPKQDLSQLMDHEKDVGHILLKMLANHLAVSEEQLLHLAYFSVRQKVAATLIQLHERFEKEPINMLREDLAALAGTAKETLIRTLTDLKDEGIISIHDNKISIEHREKLNRLVE